MKIAVTTSAAEWVAGWEAAEAEYFLSGQAPFPLNLLPA
jgi:hypothetical protein